ncbi:acetate kinase [Candidatus Enterovibrio altilux]|uniref:Acetate kinase n=1 Tax=Candidatus Enterovibrio altilux TaxID=1927128 RepID=A0A291B7R6_9GAMM|nr:acetate kinase [Candidatus Enterovibrio luxaltus]ATF09030.1 Acetate kinase [Candidatus Enterovibrio luxaltus]
MSKLVLVLNCGSSSLKFAIVDAQTGDKHLTGIAECLQLPEARIKWKLNGKHDAKLGAGAAHKEALSFIVNTILASNPELAGGLGAIGHRVVHGGEQFTASALICENVLKGIQDASIFAPLHNPAHLIGIGAAKTAFPGLKNVAVFDTAFHQTMPEEAYLYALPYKLYKENGIRRYGMHGTSHLFIARKTASLLGKSVEELNIINCHLGNGASICAIKNGQSVDTSMGMTPLEGLVMGTRSGDLDPAIIFHLHETLGYSIEQINNMLTKESGLAGLTEVTSDCRFIEDNYGQKKEATRAMNIFCHRLAKYVAGYTACLDSRLDAIVFTGGIGENSGPIRALVLNRLGLLGVEVDQERNLRARFGNEGVITAVSSRIPVMVISTNEELIIAQDTARLAEL